MQGREDEHRERQPMEGEQVTSFDSFLSFIRSARSGIPPSSSIVALPFSNEENRGESGENNKEEEKFSWQGLAIAMRRTIVFSEKRPCVGIKDKFVIQCKKNLVLSSFQKSHS